MQKSWTGFSFLFTWGFLSVFLLGLLQITQALNPNPQGRWIVTHVIDPEKTADKSVRDYLLQRKSSPHFDELVILLEPHAHLQEDLRRSGFIVSYKNRKTLLKEFPTLVPPYFLVTSPRGEGVYAGNYGKQNQDITIAESYYSNRLLSNFPISGCGNSVRAQKFFDPQAIILAQKNEP